MKPLHQASAAALLLGLTVLPQIAWADVPAPVAAMIREAAKSGDQAEFKAVVKAAKATNPDIADEIDAMAKKERATAQAAAEARHEAELRSEGYFEGWTGEGEFGFGLSRGNTHETSGVLGLDLEKDGLRLRHKASAHVDFQRTDGQTTRERFNASYTLNYKFDDQLYAYGGGMWERDKFAGFSRRFTESVGIGYSVIDMPNMSLDLEAGPSLRQTKYITGVSENRLVARASAAYKWQITDGLTFTENATALAGKGDKTLTSNTALTSKLFGAFSARLSFNVQHETNPPAGLKSTDYSTRLTGVYDF
ncbi:MAG TPA: DUF481 domain-containing protein [Alphaproteobacteria bacterium]|nr:DUF481 domain-containing protein [Alphaproteobacteria bacterium]